MNTRFHENRSVGLLLTFIGGVMDAYTYSHYDAFASAQTGNLVLAIIQGSKGEWGSVLMKLMSTLFFFAGIFVAKFFISFSQKKGVHYWRLFVLYFEALVFLLISFNFINHQQVLATVTISFTASVQWITFDKINGMAYTNLFTTGNLKGMSMNFYDYFIEKKPEAKEKFFHYFFVVVAFLLGAISSVACYNWFGSRSIILAALILFILALVESFNVWLFYKNEGANLFRSK